MLTSWIAALLLPPVDLLICAFAGCILLASKPRLGRCLIVASLTLLTAISTPIAGSALLSLLEPTFEDPLARPADAIVILGAGTYFHAPEYGGDTVSIYTLERLRYGSALWRRCSKPILLSGGKPVGQPVAEAVMMESLLTNEWKIVPQWTEDDSLNTWQNAQNSYRVLATAGIHTIYLVTHAWHMPRARMAFERAGFTVVPAPTGYSTRLQTNFSSFVPSARGLLDSSIFFHEILGLIWYRWILQATDGAS